jgi:hypothetical protein
MVPAAVVAELVSVRLAPMHTGFGEAEAVTEVGVVLTTDTVTDAVLVHDNELVPVIV